MQTITLGNGLIRISTTTQGNSPGLLFQQQAEPVPIGTDLTGEEPLQEKETDLLLLVKNRKAAEILQDGLLFLFREFNRREEAEKAETSKSDPLPQEERKKEK